MVGDFELNGKLRAFFEVEALDMLPGYAKVQEKLLVESGLVDELPQTLLAMKAVMVEYREHKSKVGKG